jgi:hypothetical protein
MGDKTNKYYRGISLLPTTYRILFNICNDYATGWMIGVVWFDSQWELGIFLFITMSTMAPGPTQPPIQSWGVENMNKPLN